MAVKAIIFDCFGVLVEDSLQSFYKTYLADKPEIVEQIKSLDHQSTEGKITYEQLLNHIVRLTSINYEEIRLFLEKNPPNSPLLEYIAQELKPHYKLGFLSNAADDWLRDLFTPDQLALFDDFVLSYQHNMRKPDVAIFKLAVGRLGFLPSEVVLVDDVDEYCHGAREAGLLAVRYVSLEQTKSELDAILK